MGETRETIRLTVNADEIVALRLILEGVQDKDFIQGDDTEYLTRCLKAIDLKKFIINLKIAELRRELQD